MAKRQTGEEEMAEAPITNDQFQQLIAALTANAKASPAGLNAESLKDILLETQRTARKEAKPENETHPGKSAFSYPEGDIVRPRPVLPFELLWNAYPVHKFPETQHFLELEHMCQLKPGEYTILRRDGSIMSVSVKAERDAAGAVTKLNVEFPVSRDEKWLIPPMSAMLYQIIHADDPDTDIQSNFVAAWQEHLTVLMPKAKRTPATVGV